MESGFKQKAIPFSGRSALVMEAVKESAVLKVSKLSDCLQLQRDDVQCAFIEDLEISIDDNFMRKVYGPSDQESREVLHSVVNHLLETFRPLNLEVTCQSAMQHFIDEFTLDGQYAKLYTIDPNIGSLTSDCIFGIYM